MPNPTVNKRILLSSKNKGYCPQAIALFTAWETLYGYYADTAFKTAVNNTILELISLNYWNHAACVPVWFNPNQNASLVDWFNPSRVFTVGGGMTFTSLDGWKGNGSTGRIELFNPGDGGVYAFTQNDNSFGTYTVTPVSENKVDLSAQNASSQGVDMLLNQGTNNQVIVKNNCGTARNNGGFLNRRGLQSSIRYGATNWTIRGGGYNIQSGNANLTDAALPIPNVPIQAFCRSVNGTFSSFSSKKHRFEYFGSSAINPFYWNRAFEKNLLLPYGKCPTKRITFNGNSITAAGLYSARVLANINDYENLDVNSRGISGQTTPEMLADAQTWVFPFTKDYLTHDVCLAWELTNSMVFNSNNAALTYSQMVDYCVAYRAAYPNAKLIVPTMLPRDGMTNRQNDADLYDDTTLNGMLRNHLVQDGYADKISDVGADPLMGQNGQNLNATYYGDPIHPNATGANRLADLYFTPDIQLYL